PAESLADLRAASAAFGAEPSLARGELLASLTRSHLMSRELDEALQRAAEALDVMRALDHPAGIATALALIGAPRLAAGQPAEGVPALEEARCVAAAHGLIAHERSAILNLVAIYSTLGRTREALAVLEEGFALSSLYASRSEEHAFLEARYHCRVIAGEL